jgi:hypothetical protein
VSFNPESRWAEVEQPLNEIDAVLLMLSQQKKVVFDKNYHNWPNRSLLWTTEDGLSRKIEISLKESMENYEVIGYASFDDSKGQRYIKMLRIKADICPPLISYVQTEIELDIERINEIKRADLVLADWKLSSDAYY